MDNTEGSNPAVRMIIKAYEEFGDKGFSDSFYVLKDNLDDYLKAGEIIRFRGWLIKLASGRPVKVYDPETDSFNYRG
jgi:uncharacterized protein (DUF488 family)